MMICIYQILPSNQVMKYLKEHEVGSLTPAQSDCNIMLHVSQTSPDKDLGTAARRILFQKIGVQDHPHSLRPLDISARCDWEGGSGFVFLHFASKGT